jgi:hypothetical protein
MKGIFDPNEYRDIQKQFTSIPSLKNASEYQPDLMAASDAQNALKWAERIVNKVKSEIERFRIACQLLPVKPGANLTCNFFQNCLI